MGVLPIRTRVRALSLWNPLTYVTRQVVVAECVPSCTPAALFSSARLSHCLLLLCRRTAVPMGNLFSRKSKHPVSEQDIAVLQLKQLRDKMKQAQKRVTQQMEKDKQVARQLVADGKRDRALLLLKRKKRMEKSLMDLDGKLEVLEKMVSDIEFAQIQLKLIDGLKTGNTVLQQLNQLLNVEDVESILQETKESAERQKEISSLISNSSFTEEEDEELERELQSLTADQSEVPVMPAVPSHEIEDKEVQPQKVPSARKEAKRQAMEAE